MRGPMKQRLAQSCAIIIRPEYLNCPQAADVAFVPTVGHRVTEEALVL
jgi:hypothetical protein